MTNFERWKDEILRLMEGEDGCPAVVNGKPVKCNSVGSCYGCEFKKNGIACVTLFIEWLCEEAKPDNKPEEPLEGIRSCEDCIYEDRSENEKPCIECKERYTLKFKPKPKESELKPCPFCGDKAEIIAFSESHKIKCENPTCKTKPSTRWFSHEKEAIEAWNTRADK